MSDLINTIVEFLKIIGDPIRFEILRRLKGSKKTAKEIEEEMDISQSYTSQQLKTLLNANLIKVEKNEDKIKMYGIKHMTIFKVLNSIQSFIIELEKERLNKILKEDKLDILK